MDAFLEAVGRFLDELAAVDRRFLGLAVLCHLLRTFAVTRAWQNVVSAAYRETRVRTRDVYAAYAAGIGVNALLPARAGDLVKLYLAHRRIRGTTYTTLASTLVVLAIFDFVVASALFLWALQAGVLPSLDVLPSLPDFDFSWLFAHPRVTAVLLGLAAVVAVVGGIWTARRVRAFRKRVAQGFAVVGERRTYLRGVAFWQAADWAFRIVALYWFLRAFGIPADAHNTLLAQVTHSLATVFPFSPSGIGTEQALVLYVLADEASRSALLAFSVGTKLVIVAVNVALGAAAIVLTLRTFRWRTVVRQARAADAATPVPGLVEPEPAREGTPR